MSERKLPAALNVSVPTRLKTVENASTSGTVSVKSDPTLSNKGKSDRPLNVSNGARKALGTSTKANPIKLKSSVVQVTDTKSGIKSNNVLPQQHFSSTGDFQRTVSRKLNTTRVAKKVSCASSSIDSWRAWPARVPPPELAPRCRRSPSYDSSDSSDVSLNMSDKESTNTTPTSTENFLTCLHNRTITVTMDKKVCNRVWKVNKLMLKRISLEKCSVRDLKLGLELITGIPADLTYIRFVCEEMQDNDSLEKAVLNGGLATLCVYSIWQDFVRILFTGNIKNITEAIALQDPNTAPVCSDVFSIMIAHDAKTRQNVSVTDILRQAPSTLDQKQRDELIGNSINEQKGPKMPMYSVVKEKNLVTEEMRSEMTKQRRYTALLFAVVNKHKALFEWISNDPSHDWTYRWSSGRNMVFFITFFRKKSQLKQLIDLKVDWQAPDVTGLTPAELSIRTHDEDIIEMFEELEDSLEDDGKKKKKRRGKSAEKGHVKSSGTRKIS